MNVCFPEAKHAVPTLFKIGSTCLVTFGVRLLNRVQVTSVNRRIGVPEVTIPLNDDRMGRNEYINNKLATDDLLLKVCNPQAVQDRSASSFKSVIARIVREAQYAVGVLLLCRMVTAGIRAMMPVSPSNQPPRYIERLTTGRAFSYLSAASFCERPLAGLFLGLWCILPSIGAFKRAESNLAPSASSGDERLTTPSTWRCQAIIAPFDNVRRGYKRSFAILAHLGFGHIVHSIIIPWRVEIVK